MTEEKLGSESCASMTLELRWRGGMIYVTGIFLARSDAGLILASSWAEGEKVGDRLNVVF